MLNSREQMYHARKTASRVAIKIFGITHNIEGDPKLHFGEYVEVDFERLVVVMLKIHGLSQRAVNTVDGELGMTGDGAGLCGQDNTAQTVIGLKMMGKYAKDPSDCVSLMGIQRKQLVSPCHQCINQSTCLDGNLVVL